MNAEQIKDEYQRNGRISGRAMGSLRALLRESGGDPYTAITLAGDVGAFQVANDILPHPNSEDGMVRWNAAGVLFTRFRDARLAGLCLELLSRELDTMVRGILLVGAGELLPFLEDERLQKQLAARLLETVETEDEFPEMRGSAYLGIEAAVGLSPIERSPAEIACSIQSGIFKQHVLSEFRQMYGV